MNRTDVTVTVYDLFEDRVWTGTLYDMSKGQLRELYDLLPGHKAEVILHMSNEEYIACHGGACPYCRSNDIEVDTLQFESAVVWQPIWCNTCGRRWDDFYELTRWEELVE